MIPQQMQQEIEDLETTINDVINASEKFIGELETHVNHEEFVSYYGFPDPYL